MSSIYTDNGYSSRENYIASLKADYGSYLVERLLPRFKPSQDFDELVIALEESYFSEQDEGDELEEMEEEENEEEI